MQSKLFSRSSPNWKNLLWALPLALAILAFTWWIEWSGWSWADYARPSGSWAREDFYTFAMRDFAISGLFAAFVVVAANWSRSIWPRVALAMFLIVAQIGFGMLFVLNFPVEAR